MAVVNEEASGYCGAEGDNGENLEWKLDKNGLLTIFGTGDMCDCLDKAPWDEYRDKIITLSIGEDVTSISSYAFEGCSRLTNLVLSDALETICSYAFGDCSNLKGNLMIPETIQSIEPYAFGGCNFDSIIFEGIPLEISYDAFNNVTASAYYLSDNSEWENLVDNDYGGDLHWICYTDNSKPWENKLPRPTTDVSTNSKVSAGTEISLCSTVSDALIYYTTDGTIPSSNSTKYENKIVIEQDTVIKAIAVKNGYENSEISTFAYTVNHTTDLKDYGWCGDNLKWTLDTTGLLTISGTGDMWDTCSWSDYSIDVKSLDIKKGVTSIGNRAFSQFEQIGKTGDALVIPDGVKRIGNDAFYDCKGLAQELHIPETVESIGINAFQYCVNLGGSLVIPDTVTSIGDSAFNRCSSLNGTLTLSSNLTSIGNSAFYWCGFTGDLLIPDSVTNIGAGAFARNNFTGTLAISKNVKCIESNTFGSNDFSGTLTISDKVDYISLEAFAFCSSLDTLIFAGNAPDIDNDVFRLVTATAYYPSWKTGWNEVKKQNYGGTLTWIPYDEGETPWETKETLSVPTANPSSGAVEKGTTISLTSTEGATIYYTTDGSIPSASSTKYTAPISITADITIKAIAVKAGYENSGVATFTYTVENEKETLSVPTANPSSGTIEKGTKITLTSTEGASIYYTVNGSTPSISSTKYTAPISITADTTIKVIAVKSGYENSAVATFTYTVEKEKEILSTPTANPSSGTIEKGTKITLTSTEGASIYYTVNGSTPSISSTKYTAPISITADITIKAIAVKAGYENSGVATFTYTVENEKETLSVPTANPSSGTVEKGTKITLTSTEGGTIYYTTDGSTPSASSTKYTAPINITSDTTIKAIAVKSGYQNSEVATFIYKVKQAEVTPPKDDSSSNTPSNPPEDKPSNDNSNNNFKDDTSSKDDIDDSNDETPIETPPIEDAGDVDSSDVPEDGEIPQDVWVTSVGDAVYTGSAIKPEIRVYDGKNLLEEGKDYTASYKNNVNTSSSNSFSSPQIVINLKGSYSGSQIVYFKIQPVDISTGVCAANDLAVKYTGKNQNPTPTLLWNGKKLSYGKDFDVAEYGNGTLKDAGIHTLTLKGKNNFTGERKITLTISDDKNQIDMSKVTIKGISNQSYTGRQLTPTATSVVYKKATLVANKEYTITYGANVEVGTGTVTFTGTGKANGDGISFIGSKTVTFKITGGSISKAKVSGIKKQYPYTGKLIKPTATLTYQANKNSTSTTLREGTDYTVTYKKNKNKGTATIIFTGINGYTGTKKQSFKIGAGTIDANIDVAFKDTAHMENGIYVATSVKGGVKPEVIVKDGSKTLELGKDYTVKYKNNKKAGLYTDKKAPSIIIKGKGNYKGSKTVTFTIK